MKHFLYALAATGILLGCGKSGDLFLESDAERVGHLAQTGGHFLDVESFPMDKLDIGGDRDIFIALVDQRMVEPRHPTTTYLRDDDLVIGVVINGDARAYPHNIFWWHEIAHDIVGGIPIIVTFCPLTGTGIAFDGRDRDGSRILLGVSGLLFNNNLIMYDQRDQETLYPQLIGHGISGPRKGEALRQFPVVETTWAYWRELYPNTRVVSGLTDFDPGGIYAYNPYKRSGTDSNRDMHDNIPFDLTPRLENNPIGNLFRAKDLVLGVRFGEIAQAYPFVNMGNRAAINDEVAGHPILVIWHETAQMAVPFFREIEGQTLTFDMIESNNPTFPFLVKDRETETVWNLRGEGIHGTYSGRRLNQAPATNAFWFAWATFWQNTGIY